MDGNKELLQAIQSMIEPVNGKLDHLQQDAMETRSMLQTLQSEVDAVKAEEALTTDALQKEMKDLKSELYEGVASLMEEQTRKIQLSIENGVTQQVKSLQDGYITAVEQNARLQAEKDVLAQRVDQLENRVTAIENRTA